MPPLYPPEPRIEINGNMLSEAEAMTIRVAIENFAMDLIYEGLGNDERGEALTKNYLKQIENIRKYIFRK